MDRSRARGTPSKDAPPEVEFAAYLPHIRRRWLAQQEAASRADEVPD